MLHIDDQPVEAGIGDLFFSDAANSSRCNESRFKMYYVTFEASDNEVIQEIESCFAVLSAYRPSMKVLGLDNDFKTFCSEVSLAKPGGSLVAKYSLIGILIKLWRELRYLFAYEGQKPGISHQDLIERLLGYIRENYDQCTDLSRLSQEFGLNERYLNRIFKRITGQTIGKYTVKMRVEAAKRLLDVTNMQISDIASEVGFFDCAHFCRTFKELEGSTPMSFRRRG